MLPAFTWLTPFDEKSSCPHTWPADLTPDPDEMTRLLPLSATNRFPAGSSLTSVTLANVLADAYGKAVEFSEVVVKFTWPQTPEAAAPDAAPDEKTSIRLSFATAT